MNINLRTSRIFPSFLFIVFCVVLLGAVYRFSDVLASNVISSSWTVIFCLIILGAAIVGALWIFWKTNAVSNKIMALRELFIEKYQNTKAEEDFKNKYASKAPGFYKAADCYKKQIESFKQFDGTLISVSGQSGEAFFNEESVIESDFTVDFWRSFPGILTGLGILFTFVGLSGGIYLSNQGLFSGQQIVVDITDLSALTEPLVSLLDGAAQAFLTSICGLFFSMILSFIFHYRYSAVLEDLQVLVEDLNEKFVPKSTSSFLNSQLEVARQEYVAVKLFTESWEGHVSKLFEDLTANYAEDSRKQTEAMVTALEKIEAGITLMSQTQGKQVSDAVTNAAGVMAEELSKQIQGMTASFADSSNAVKASVEALDGMLGHVTTTIETTSTALLGNVEELRKTVAESNDSFVKDIETMSGKLLEVRESLDKIGEEFGTLAEHISSASADMKTAGETAASSLTKGAEEAGTSFKASSEDSGRLFGEKVNEVGEKLKGDFESISATMSEASSGIKEAGESLAERLKFAADVAVKNVEDAGQESGKEFDEKIGAVVQGFAAELSAISESMANASKQMKEAGETVAATLIDGAREAGDSFKSSGKESGELFGENVVSAGKALGDHLTKTGEDIRMSSDKILEASETLKSGFDKSGEILATGATNAAEKFKVITEEAGGEFYSWVKAASTDFNGDLNEVVKSTRHLIQKTESVSATVEQTLNVVEEKLKQLAEAEGRSLDLASSYETIARLISDAANQIGTKVDQIDKVSSQQNSKNIELNAETLRTLKEVVSRVQGIGNMQSAVAKQTNELQQIVREQMMAMAQNLKLMNDNLRKNIADADGDLANSLDRLSEALFNWTKQTEKLNAEGKMHLQSLRKENERLSEQQKWVHDSVKLMFAKQREL